MHRQRLVVAPKLALPRNRTNSRRQGCTRPRITRGRLFFITVRADCIFLGPPSRPRGCPIWRIAWKEGHLITCSWQSCPATPSRPRPREPTILDAILAENEEQDQRRGCPFYLKAVGTAGDFSPSLRLSFLFTPPPFFAPFSLAPLFPSPSLGRLFNRA